MTSTATITTVIVAALGAMGFATFQATAAELPIKELLGLGSTGIALAMCVLFLREQREMRKEHAEVVVKATNTFSETVKQIHSETRASSERRESELHGLIREIKKP